MIHSISLSEHFTISTRPAPPGSTISHSILLIISWSEVGLYATAWFQTMCVGGAHPAPSDLAPRIVDNLLLDGHLGIVFALSLAVLRVEALAISALQGEALIDALKARLPEIARDCPRLPERAPCTELL